MNAAAELTENALIARDKADGERAANESPDALLAGIEYQIGKLELKHGDILVVKLNRGGVSQKEHNQLQYNMQKFIGRQCRVMTIDPDIDLSVISGAKVPK